MESMGAGRCSFGTAVLLGLFGALSGPSERALADAPPYFKAFNAQGKVEFNRLGVPAEALPVLDLEGLLAKARAGEDPQQWVPGLKRFSGVDAAKGPAAALKSVALCWEARAQVQEWDKLLRGAYRRKARFPESLDALLQNAPEALRKDPWGEAWAYRATAPTHSPKLVGQRYQLGPSRYPELAPLEALGKTPPPRFPAGVTLEFLSLSPGEGGAKGGEGPLVSLKVKDNRPAVMQAQRWSGAYQLGERFGDFWVVWIQRGGVILGHPDGLLALPL
jgi:hypothetical protein